MRLICLLFVLLTGCAGKSTISSRVLASDSSTPSVFDACRKDMPLSAEALCAKAEPGYIDCREDYSNSSPSTCLRAKAGFADCRRDYLNLSVVTCLAADSGYKSCREQNTAAECLGER